MKQCIWRAAGNPEKARCEQTAINWCPAAVCCTDHSAAYSMLRPPKRKLLRDAASTMPTNRAGMAPVETQVDK